MVQAYSRPCLNMLGQGYTRCWLYCQMRRWASLNTRRSLRSFTTALTRTTSALKSVGIDGHHHNARLPIPKSTISCRGGHSSEAPEPHPSSNPSSSYMDDTIYALSTASGRAAIAVIRISGSACVDIYSAMCSNQPLPPVQRASVRTLYDPTLPHDADAILDANALVLLFRAPKSATGEDVLEFHVHGGLAVVHAVLQAISQCKTGLGKIRHAEPGEFTRRAFFNRRLDLTQVEALGDMLSAATEQQRKLSLRSADKRLATRYEQWRAQLLLARGELEALIDFSEDQHFEESPIDLVLSVLEKVVQLKKHIDMHLYNATRGELLRNGIRVALLGVPNAGKSSLLNRIVGRDAAIVSQEAGTTRDIVEIGLDIGGYLCRFGDMAGLRTNTETSSEAKMLSPVEMEGIARAREWILESDIVVVISAVGQDAITGERPLFNSEVLEVVNECSRRNICTLGVINKIDLLVNKNSSDASYSRRLIREQFQLLGISTNRMFETSCIRFDHKGVEGLKLGIVETCRNLINPSPTKSGDLPNSSQDSIGASERHRSLLGQCLIHMDQFLREVAPHPYVDDHLPEQADIVLAAEALREGADCLAKITGQGYVNDVDEVLGVVFEKFCVGK